MSSKPETRPSNLDPSFVKLSPTIYFRDFPEDPHVDNDNAKPNEPSTHQSQGQTIVLLFWMGASLRNATKYISEYIKLAPQARIIFILTSTSDFFVRPSEAAHIRRVRPIVDVLLSSSSGSATTTTAAAPANNGPLYFHVFSNGGAVTLRNIAVEYRNETNTPLPVKGLVIDSAPGTTSFAVGYKAISYGFPKTAALRFFSSILACLGLCAAYFLGFIMRVDYPSELARAGLNNTRLINSKAERCYVYSELDDLVSSKDVESHSKEAEAGGWVVSREKFHNSPHVSHMRTDPQRYWKIVTRYLKIAFA